MKKRTRIIILVASVVLLLCLFVVGYVVLKQGGIKTDDSTYYHIVQEYIKSDAEFSEQYGKPLVISPYGDKSVQYVKKNVCLIPCVVKVESGDEYHVWVGYDCTGTDKILYLNSVELITA